MASLVNRPDSPPEEQGLPNTIHTSQPACSAATGGAGVRAVTVPNTKHLSMGTSSVLVPGTRSEVLAGGATAAASVRALPVLDGSTAAPPQSTAEPSNPAGGASVEVFKKKGAKCCTDSEE